MNTLEKILNVLTKNMGYTVVFVVAVFLFAIFSDGLLSGLITAASAAIAYGCAVALVREYKKTPAPKATTVKAKPKSKKK